MKRTENGKNMNNENHDNHENRKRIRIYHPDGKGHVTDRRTADLVGELAAGFQQEPTQENLFLLLSVLREADVWVPCTAVPGEEDQRRWREAVEQAGDDPRKLIGTTFTNREPLRMIPDILQNAGELFFPVFSSEEEMGEYGRDFSHVEVSMTKAVRMARANANALQGIVLNAFTHPFRIDREAFYLFEEEGKH